MATEIVEIITDDLTGTKGAAHIAFSLDGTDYEIDLGKRNEKALRELFEQYAPHARRVIATRTARGRLQQAHGGGGETPRTASKRREDADVRKWCQQNGHLVANRGRIPVAALEAYRDAQEAARRAARSSNGSKAPAAPQVVLSGSL